jgi:hypothetical protein
VQGAGRGEDTWDFSPVTGGVFYAWLRRVRLVHGDQLRVLRAALLLLVLGLGPVLLLAALERAWTSRVDVLLTDLSVYARFAVAVPLFLLAERVMHVRCKRAVEIFGRGRFARDDQQPALRRALVRAERLRDLRAVELGLLAAAVLGGQASLWGVTGLAGVAGAEEGVADAYPITIARLWYGTVALPLFQFLITRWLWQWSIWSRVLWDLSRLRLQLVPTHPDHCGGVGSLSDPTLAFAFFSAGASSVIAAAWGTRIAFRGAALTDFALPFALLATLAALVAYGPLLWFAPAMVRARYEGVCEYGRVALAHARLFHHRWVEQEVDDSLLGSPDVSSLADLGAAYESMAQMRIVPFGPRSVITLAAGLTAPIIPLIALEIPLPELLLKMGKALFLGLPS